MNLKDVPIKRKLTTVIMLTSSVVLLLTSAAFISYEVLTFRGHVLQNSQAIAQIIAASSTAALTFGDEKAGMEILSKLQAEETVLMAALYDGRGNVLAWHPENMPVKELPGLPEKDGYKFERGELNFFVPVREGGNRIGTLYLQTDLTPIYERLWLYCAIVGLVMVGTLLTAFVLSSWLQKQISQPILKLAETPKAISRKKDYTTRAQKYGEDEVGLFTDAFNQMLAQIHEQNQALSESEVRVRAVLNSAVSAGVVIDSAGKIIDWNSRAEGMFGWKRDEAIGRVLADTIIPERYRERHQRGMEHFMATGEGPVLNQVLEISALRRNGEEFPVELSISPLKTGGERFCAPPLRSNAMTLEISGNP